MVISTSLNFFPFPPLGGSQRRTYLGITRFRTRELNLTCAAPGEVTAHEAEDYRARLHEIGPDAFIKETISRGSISAKKLLSAFGVKIPAFLVDQPDETCYPLLGLAIQRELNKRPRLRDHQTLDDAAELLKKSKRVIIITGAGVSFT